MINLDVPVIEQKKSLPCGHNSLFMVSRFLGLKVTKSKIKAMLPKEKLLLPQIAEAASHLGFNTKMIITNYTIFPKNSGNKNKAKFVKNIMEKFTDIRVKNYCKELLNYLKIGGKVEFRLFQLDDIKSSLKKKKPCIVEINSASFSGKFFPPWKSHFIVIKGVDKKDFILNTGRKRSIKKNIVESMFSFYRPLIPNILIF